ncbi:MAG: methyltransferase, partial [archaeon]|nr:methyltransferase [archaeon]
MLDVELDLKAKDGQRRKATKMNAATAPYFVDFLGKRIMVYPHVFYPEIDTELLAKSARVNPSDRVFEPFAGTGAIAIFLSNQSAAVVATDVNPDAVKNISENIRLHGLEKKARIELANIFPSSNEKFDVIVA